MRLNRRLFLFGGGSLAAVSVLAERACARPRAARDAKSITISATPITHLSVTDRNASRFGRVTFRSGLHLQSADDGFGGFSGLWRSPNGRRIVALADNAQWLTANVETTDGRLSGLSDAVLAPLLFENGKPLRETRYYDTESLTISNGIAYVGVERRHAVMRFDWAREDVEAKGQLLPIPRGIAEVLSDLPSNNGLEAIAIAPAQSPLAGAVLAVAEHAYRGESPYTLGFILTGARRGFFRVERSSNYDISDMAFLPNGDLVLLERQLNLLQGFRIRLRRIAAGLIRPGARVDGDTLYENEPSHEIDNMEGLGIHQDGGQTIFTLISDNNFNWFQRTLLLEFSLDG